MDTYQPSARLTCPTLTIPDLVLSQAVIRPELCRQSTSARLSPLFRSVSRFIIVLLSLAINSLDVCKPHAAVKDGDSPTGVARCRVRHDANVDKCQRVLGRIKSVLVKRQRPSGFVLNKNITLPISVPVGQVDTNAWPRHVQRDARAVTPFGRLLDVGEDLSSMTILIDPHIVIRTGAAHVAVEDAVALSLGTSPSQVLPHDNIKPPLFFLEIDVVQSTRTVDSTKLNIALDALVTLTLVSYAGISPVGVDSCGYQSSNDPYIDGRKAWVDLPGPHPRLLIQVCTLPLSPTYM